MTQINFISVHFIVSLANWVKNDEISKQEFNREWVTILFTQVQNVTEYFSLVNTTNRMQPGIKTDPRNVTKSDTTFCLAKNKSKTWNLS